VKVCVFAGARGNADLYPDAEWIGAELAKRGHHVYFGGSSKGIMGAVARGVQSQQGLLTGILPKSIHRLKHYDESVDIVVTEDMPSRKAIMWGCDAFICLPGGAGTMDELWEIWTHIKLGHEQARPVVVYNQAGFYTPLHGLLQQMFKHGTMPADRLQLVQIVGTKEDTVDAIEPMASEDTTPTEPVAC
jgi:uncharacterized protein (TIGR00730 family)